MKWDATIARFVSPSLGARTCCCMTSSLRLLLNSLSCAARLPGALALAVAGPPLGVFLILRRMALTGDAMAHAILPGAALGYLAAGLSLGPMTIGGLVAGLIVAVGSGIVARTTILREDASLAAFYLISLALGVTIVSLRGSNIDLLHVLFGSVLALDDATLILLAAIASVTLAALAALYRPLVLETVDAGVSRFGQPQWRRCARSPFWRWLS